MSFKLVREHQLRTRVPVPGKRQWAGLVLASSLALGACAKPVEAPTGAVAVAAPSTATPPPTAPLAPSQAATQRSAHAELPRLVVTKTPTCGCCHLWVEHMQQAGFQVEIHDVDDLGPVKERVGVPYGKGSCHTAEVGGYFVEGHVPAEDVKRLLAERPAAKGLTVPGMPMGSPGMETPDGRVQPYVVELVAKDGSTSPFARHGQ